MPALSGVARPHGRRRPPCGGVLLIVTSQMPPRGEFTRAGCAEFGLHAVCDRCEFTKFLGGDAATLDTIAAAAREHIDRQVRSTR